MRRGSVLQREGLVHLDLHHALPHHIEQISRDLLQVRPLRRVGGERRARQVQAALGRQDADIHRRHRTRGIAEAHHQPERRQAVDAGVPGVLAHAVIHRRHHGPAGDPLHLGRQIAMAHHRMRRTVRTGEFRLLLGRDHADDRRAEVLRPLAKDQPHAAGGGMHHDRVAGLHRIGAADQVLRRHALQHHRRGGLEIDAVGHLHQTVGGDHPLGRIAAQRAGIGDAVAGLHGGHACADSHHRAGALLADDQRHHRRLVQARPEIHVDVVEPDRLLLDQRLALSGLGARHVLPFHHLGTARRVDADGLDHDVLRGSGPDQAAAEGMGWSSGCARASSSSSQRLVARPSPPE